MKVFTNKKKMRGYREFLYILPFIILVAIFAYSRGVKIPGYLRCF